MYFRVNHARWQAGTPELCAKRFTLGLSKTGVRSCPQPACNDRGNRSFPREKRANYSFSHLLNIGTAIWPRECKMRRRDPNPDVPKGPGFRASCGVWGVSFRCSVYGREVQPSGTPGTADHSSVAPGMRQRGNRSRSAHCRAHGQSAFQPAVSAVRNQGRHQAG
jgi:hypothetical protein